MKVALALLPDNADKPGMDSDFNELEPMIADLFSEVNEGKEATHPPNQNRDRSTGEVDFVFGIPSAVSLTLVHSATRSSPSEARRMTTHIVRQHRSTIVGLEPVSLVSKRSFPRHFHDQFGFGVMLSGGHRSWSARGMVEALPGHVICVNPGEVHDGMGFNDGVRSWRMIYADPSVVTQEAGDEIEGTPEISRPVIADQRLAELVQGLFNSAMIESPEPMSGEENLLHCIAYLLRTYGVRRRKLTSSVPSIRGALERLRAQPERPTSLSELSSIAGVSRFQFLRAFTRQIGITPHAYLIQLRVHRARHLLAKGHAIADTAVMAGFADQSHMTRCFVGRLGITPHQYQKAVC